MLNAAYLTTGFVVLAVGARYLIAGRHVEEGRTMLRMAIGLTAMLAPLQICIGDQHGLNTLAASADQDRGDGGALGRQQAGRFPDLRLAGREERDQPFRDFDSERRLAHPHAPHGTACFPA